MKTDLHDRMFYIKKQSVNLQDVGFNGLTLDIGGGGEGIIGRIGKSQVVAIDKNKKELEEAPQGPLKIMMNASRLHFINNSFNYVTSFFTLMYMPTTEHYKVFKEIFMVLKPGGKFIVWDVAISKPKEMGKDIFFVPIEIKLVNETINTGYGVLCDGHEQDLAYYCKLGKHVGFEVQSESTESQLFNISFKKAVNQHS